MLSIDMMAAREIERSSKLLALCQLVAFLKMHPFQDAYSGITNLRSRRACSPRMSLSSIPPWPPTAVTGASADGGAAMALDSTRRA
jgi:hypothetical protein